MGLLAAFSALASMPNVRPGMIPTGSGSEKFEPTKCEWLAVELNANFRERKPGFSSQFYCRPPSTIVLSYRYHEDAELEAVNQDADSVRETVSRVAAERKWRWIKIEEDIAKADAALKPKPKPSPAAPSGASAEVE